MSRTSIVSPSRKIHNVNCANRVKSFCDSLEFTLNKDRKTISHQKLRRSVRRALGLSQDAKPERHPEAFVLDVDADDAISFINSLSHEINSNSKRHINTLCLAEKAANAVGFPSWELLLVQLQTYQKLCNGNWDIFRSKCLMPQGLRKIDFNQNHPIIMPGFWSTGREKTGYGEAYWVYVLRNGLYFFGSNIYETLSTFENQRTWGYNPKDVVLWTVAKHVISNGPKSWNFSINATQTTDTAEQQKLSIRAETEMLRWRDRTLASHLEKFSSLGRLTPL